MKNTVMTVFCLVILVWGATVVGAAELIVAAGAGYRKMVTEVATYCSDQEGIKTEMSFGNLGQILAQVKTSGMIPVVIGARSYFKRAGFPFSDVVELGQGHLVLAWRKGLTLGAVREIATGKVRTIAIPDLQKAIYGRAGSEFLQSSGLQAAVKDKLRVVATVPQVNSYLITGEVDAGFGNLTDVLGVADKLGGYLVISEGYRPIEIIAGVVPGHADDPGVRSFLKCLQTPEARTIAVKHGL